MKEWTCRCRNIFTNHPLTNGSTGKILVADVHRPQQTDPVEKLFQSKKTILVTVLPGRTSQFQPLNFVINKSFKKQSRSNSKGT